MDPVFDLIQNCCARSFETTTAVSVSILGFFCISDIVENICFGYESLSQAIAIGDAKAKRCSNLGPAKRLFRVQECKWRDSLSVRTPDHRFPSVAQSTVLINIEDRVGSEVVNGPDS